MNLTNQIPQKGREIVGQLPPGAPGPIQVQDRLNDPAPGVDRRPATSAYRHHRLDQRPLRISQIRGIPLGRRRSHTSQSPHQPRQPRRCAATFPNTFLNPGALDDAQRLACVLRDNDGDVEAASCSAGSTGNDAWRYRRTRSVIASHAPSVSDPTAWATSMGSKISSSPPPILKLFRLGEFLVLRMIAVKSWYNRNVSLVSGDCPDDGNVRATCGTAWGMRG